LIDIPPVIYIATQYLRALYGDQVCSYRETRGMQTIDPYQIDGRKFFCLPPWQLEKLNVRIDLFHNASSFSEMSPAIVDRYAGAVRKLSRPNTAVWLDLNVDTASSDGVRCSATSLAKAFAWSKVQRQDDVDGALFLTASSGAPTVAQVNKKTNRNS
jgi:hypothetical protein